MPIGIRPRVNEAREFLEIAKDFKDPKEIIREALSNSWDAGASYVELKFDLARIPGTRRNKIIVHITDDGQGMSDADRPAGAVSEIESFFNLGDSWKPRGSIGSKGHGTKIYYKSEGIRVDTWKDGTHIRAESEVPPWATLQKKEVPTYRYDKDIEDGIGTQIRIDGFIAQQKEFKVLDTLIEYIRWYTVLGSFGGYFDDTRTMEVRITPAGSYSTVNVPFGFTFPDESTNLEDSTSEICKIFGPETIECGRTDSGKILEVQFVGALLGESLRSVVPDTYNDMGLWLCTDFIRIERDNQILEDIFGGQYYYRNMLLFANCQEFDLTANRNNIRRNDQEFDIAMTGIQEMCRRIWEDEFTKSYFFAKKREEERASKQEKQRMVAQHVVRKDREREERINRYKARPGLEWAGLPRAVVKEPSNEAETALLLQAMISSGHPGIDFVIGDYNTSRGVDMVIETSAKQVDNVQWAEIVYLLENLFKWEHPPSGYHRVICYGLGGVKEKQVFPDGSEAQLVRKGVAGRYAMIVGDDTLDVYVLREILQGAAGPTA